MRWLLSRLLPPPPLRPPHPPPRPTPAHGQPAELVLATTTSTQDSGLLDYLLPIFEQEFNVKVEVIAVGSGQALQMGKDGNADVLLVHSPAAEKDVHGRRARRAPRRRDVQRLRHRRPGSRPGQNQRA